MPGAASQYSHGEVKRNSTASIQHENLPPQAPFFQHSQPFPQMYTTTPTQISMPPPSLHERAPSFGQQSFGSSISQPMPSPTSIRHHAQSVSMPSSGWQDALFDDPGIFNFDLASMNFGNRYGALEFGMLGKMATGAGETPESDTGTRGSSVGQYQMPFGSISESPQLDYGQPSMDWSNGINFYGNMAYNNNGPNAFAIESSNMHNFTSPEAHSNTPEGGKHDDSPMTNLNVQNPQHLNLTNATSGSFLPLTSASAPDIKAATNPPVMISTPQLKAKSQLPVKPHVQKRPRDPSTIYTSVTTPYPYTTGFHSLIAYLQRRFTASPSKTLAIAKSLASIRPSFIATTKTLNREDLIFMEKCFQRTLWEYEGFIESVGTPTIVARRTGEIAAVGKEFQILTGWKKNVLLGREPNLNVNTGHTGNTPGEAGSGANTKSKGTGMNTPARRKIEDENGEANGGRQQPVFLAELLDDDSVVQFYEDFARLAFGDSRGSVMRQGKLLKYRTKDDELAINLAKAKHEAAQNNGTVEERSASSPEMARVRHNLNRLDSFAMSRPQDAKKGISGEKGLSKLGGSDSIEVSYCVTIKRDVFEVPMAIVLNFLPCI